MPSAGSVMGEEGSAVLRITQKRSAIGSKPKHRGALRSLGLGRIGRSNTLPDRPEIWGMIHRVPHLVEVEELEVEELGVEELGGSDRPAGADGLGDGAVGDDDIAAENESDGNDENESTGNESAENESDGTGEPNDQTA